MKKTLILTLVIILFGGAFYLIWNEPRSTPAQVTVGFLGMKNDPALGPSAVLRITGASGGTIWDPTLETKTGEVWIARTAPPQCQVLGMPDFFGPHDSARISMSPHTSFTAMVAQPGLHAVWRVRFKWAAERSIPETVLSRVTLGATDRFFAHGVSFVISPEIRE